MAEMIDTYLCPGCGERHKIPPYSGYKLGIDFGRGGDKTAVVIGKAVPDGAGGILFVVLDVQTRTPEHIE